MNVPERYNLDRKELASALRSLRQDAGLTGVEAARRAGMSQPKISKLETSALLPSTADAETLLDLYGTEATRRAELIDLVGRLHATVESNRTILSRGAARKQRQIGEVEAGAADLCYFSPSVVPGLLQSAEYMRQVFALGLSGADLTAAVAARQERQGILYDTTRHCRFVLTESVLRWRFATDDAMAAQLGHIASLSTLAGVEIGVIPFSSRPRDIPLHGFEVFDQSLVTVGMEHATVTVTDPSDIATYLQLFDTLAAAAQFGEEARETLITIARTYRA